jgi:hypothetical protein
MLLLVVVVVVNMFAWIKYMKFEEISLETQFMMAIVSKQPMWNNNNNNNNNNNMAT